MKKFFSTLAGLIVIAIVVLVVCLFLAWSRIPDILASHLSKKMQVPVSIEDVRVTKDTIALNKLEIGNPQGYSLPRAFSAENILVNAPLTHYLKHDIVIDEIVISTVYLGAEFDRPGTKSGNWTAIMQNYKNASSPPSEGKSGKSVLIKRLILTDINVDLAYRTGGVPMKSLKPISKIEFTNVTSEKGIPSEQITNVILQQALRAIFEKENIQNMIEGFMISPEKGVENLLSPLQGIFP
jgi:uncharacterized protein involved in outer membrane biogenesis